MASVETLAIEPIDLSERPTATLTITVAGDSVELIERILRKIPTGMKDLIESETVDGRSVAVTEIRCSVEDVTPSNNYEVWDAED